MKLRKKQQKQKVG